MITIQSKIDDILQNNSINKQEKITQISTLLKGIDCNFFSDFDDTITDYRCLLYSKYKYLSKKGKVNAVDITNDFKINEKFLEFFNNKSSSNIVIISSNNKYFIEETIKKHNELFNKSGINVIGIIGSTNGFKITLKDKQHIIQNSKPYISDIMEYNKFKIFKNYVCLDSYSLFNYIKTIITKIYYLLQFIIKNV